MSDTDSAPTGNTEAFGQCASRSVSLPGCRATRWFYEERLGLPLAGRWSRRAPGTGKESQYMHLFLSWATATSLRFLTSPRRRPTSTLLAGQLRTHRPRGGKS